IKISLMFGKFGCTERFAVKDHVHVLGFHAFGAVIWSIINLILGGVLSLKFGSGAWTWVITLTSIGLILPQVQDVLNDYQFCQYVLTHSGDAFVQAEMESAVQKRRWFRILWASSAAAI